MNLILRKQRAIRRMCEPHSLTVSSMSIFDYGKDGETITKCEILVFLLVKFVDTKIHVSLQNEILICINILNLFIQV